MRTLTLARLELRRFTGGGPLRRAALVAMLLVPLLYGGTYLWAFWDPDKGLDRVPAALAVEDRPAAGPAGPVTAGADLAGQLEQRKLFAWRRMSAAAARAGVDDGRYALALIIPADFSSTLVQSGGGTPRQAVLEVRTNDAVNYLAGRVGTAAFREVRAAASAAATREYLNQIFLATAAGADGVRTASGGAAQLAAGLRTVDEGAATLATGARDTASGAQRLTTGLSSAATGGRALTTGARAAATGSTQLADGLRTLQAQAAPLPGALTALAAASATVADGAAAGPAAAARSADAANAVRGATTELARKLDAYAATGDPRNLAGAADLAAQTQAAAAALAGGLDALAQRQLVLLDGTRTLATETTAASRAAQPLSAAITRARDAAGDLSAGTAGVAAGAERLATAVGLASGGSASLTAAAGRLADGASRIQDGVSAAAGGATSLATALRHGADAAALPAGTAAEHAGVMSDPVRLDTVAVNGARNYGTGLSPYFLPLALWVGAWLVLLFLSPLNRRAVAARAPGWRVAVAGWLPVAAISVAQSAVLLVVLTYGLGLQPAHGLAFAGFLILSGITFAAILQMLTAVLGAPGRLLGIVLLVLQLVTAGGTYPVETEPAPLRWLSPLLPMTHMVRGLRATVLGGDAAAIARPAAVLVGYLAVALLLTTMAAVRDRRWTPRRLWPELDLVVR